MANMLPFLKPKKIGAVLLAKRKSDGSEEPLHEEGSASPEALSLANDLISAIDAKDPEAIALIIDQIKGE